MSAGYTTSADFSIALSEASPVAVSPKLAGGLILPAGIAELVASMNDLREQKTRAVAKAVRILEQDPSIADLKPCAGAVTDECIAPRPTTPVGRRDARSPVLAALPAIERKIALLIGEGDYPGAIPKLSSPAKDVAEIGQLYREAFGYEVRTLSNASKAQIVRELNRLIRQSAPNDSITIFYAGHGQVVEKTGRGYWIPSQASADDPAQWISNADIAKFLENIPAKQLLLVSDSCYSGTLAREGKIERDEVLPTADAVLERRSVAVLSSGGTEPVADAGKDGHSVFAWHFIQNLKGVTDWSKGVELYQRLSTAVQRDFPQEPQYGAALGSGHQPGGDFLFEVRRY
jgi:hypothetical protein